MAGRRAGTEVPVESSTPTAVTSDEVDRRARYHRDMGDPQADATNPATIHADRAAGTLQIGWRDGHSTTFPAVTLRWLCPCAYCRGEAGLPGWLDSAPTLTPDQVRLVDVSLVGQYALAPTWADGHHTGFYTFTSLRAMCPCTECTNRRIVEGRPAVAGPGHADHAGPTDRQPTPPAGRPVSSPGGPS